MSRWQSHLSVVLFPLPAAVVQALLPDVVLAAVLPVVVVLLVVMAVLFGVLWSIVWGVLLTTVPSLLTVLSGVVVLNVLLSAVPWTAARRPCPVPGPAPAVGSTEPPSRGKTSSRSAP